MPSPDDIAERYKHAKDKDDFRIKVARDETIPFQGVELYDFYKEALELWEIKRLKIPDYIAADKVEERLEQETAEEARSRAIEFMQDDSDLTDVEHEALAWVVEEGTNSLGKKLKTHSELLNRFDQFIGS